MFKRDRTMSSNLLTIAHSLVKVMGRLKYSDKESKNVHFRQPQLNQERCHFQFGFTQYFIIALPVQHKSENINQVKRSRRTKKHATYTFINTLTLKQK